MLGRTAFPAGVRQALLVCVCLLGPVMHLGADQRRPPCCCLACLLVCKPVFAGPRHFIYDVVSNLIGNSRAATNVFDYRGTSPDHTQNGALCCTNLEIRNAQMSDSSGSDPLLDYLRERSRLAGALQAPGAQQADALVATRCDPSMQKELWGVVRMLLETLKSAGLGAGDSNPCKTVSRANISALRLPRACSKPSYSRACVLSPSGLALTHN